MYFDTQVRTNSINEYIPPLTQILKKCNPAEVNISVTAAPYHCIIGAKRLVNDCNGGNHAECQKPPGRSEGTTTSLMMELGRFAYLG